MPAPTNDAAKRKLALIHAMRAEINRKHYLEALELPTHTDTVLRSLRAATLALDPQPDTGAGGFSIKQ